LYKIPANTLFMGKKLVFVPDCPSTNALALQISQQSPVNEGTLVITNDQTAGKGQRGNVWETEPGKNLTFSLILKPKFLAVDKQFFLNIVICLALKDYLKEKTSYATYIKWPNDILVHEKKISGILIENQLQSSTILTTIAGIGLNVNQKHFKTPSATSMTIVTSDMFDLEAELPILLGFIESRYIQLKQGYSNDLMNLYLDALYRRHEKHTFSSHGNLFEGVIEDLDHTGRLRIRMKDEIKSFSIKEIQYV
jgi:BirA family transcriptional regulator, biotin operon repressor / biotin---[acetyl-CoA-carboxylase] ligase